MPRILQWAKITIQSFSLKDINCIYAYISSSPANIFISWTKFIIGTYCDSFSLLKVHLNDELYVFADPVADLSMSQFLQNFTYIFFDGTNNFIQFNSRTLNKIYLGTKQPCSLNFVSRLYLLILKRRRVSLLYLCEDFKSLCFVI